MIVNKPKWRENDDMPRRGDDIKFSFMGATVEANGRTVVMVVIAAVMILLGVWGWWDSGETQRRHDERTAKDHAEVVSATNQLISTVELQICVLTLNDMERIEFRRTGRYCGGSRASMNARAHVSEEPNTEDSTNRGSKRFK